jgi:tRNA threonylcarbamoyladenosine biosynthesis protein TsaE
MTHHEAVRLTTGSEAETRRLGALLTGLLPLPCVVALRGDLGAGKTCLVSGMAETAGGTAPTHSPTFTLVNEYPGSPTLYHVDLYRLSEPAEALDLGVEEFFASPGEPAPHPQAVCVVEWAERAGALLPDQRLDVTLEHAGGDRRRITLLDQGILPEGWTESLREAGLSPGPVHAGEPHA